MYVRLCTSDQIFRSRDAVNLQSFHSNVVMPTPRGTKRMLMVPGPPSKFAKRQKVEMSIRAGGST